MKMKPQLQWRPQDTGDTKMVGGPPSTMADMQYRWPEPMAQAACAADGGTREVRCPSSLEPEDHDLLPGIRETLSYTVGL